jgi:hypothetical protein
MNPRSKILIGLCSAVWAATLIAGLARADDAPVAPEPGVWQLHKLAFDYFGFTSTYSCDGLADTLRRLLLIAGARADVHAEPGACGAPEGRPDKFARADLSFYTLAPAGSAGNAGEPGQGRWQAVDLTAHHPLDLQIGDCELVEQFRDRILKKMFAIRNLEDGTFCVPHQESGSLIDLRFDAFVGAPGPVTAAVPRPAPERLFAYPKNGQGPNQQATDRAECRTAAIGQSGFDPSMPPDADAASKGQAYANAYAGCLEARGYSVK